MTKTTGVRRRPSPSYSTRLGRMYCGRAETLLVRYPLTRYRKRVQLIITSPPFPLNRKKQYGNLNGDEYVEWLAAFASLFRDYLSARGSIVIELGNAWDAGRPVMSTLSLRALLRFQEAANLHVCQQFVCHNPARLPSPVEWVNKRRIRVKDAYTHVWWMSKTSRPFADNRKVLVPYSSSMKRLLRNGTYNSGSRPSEHDIGRHSFLTNHGGAIPSNVLTFTNTSANDSYLAHCRRRGCAIHPARMPPGLVEFFVRFLTKPGDYVMDPFAGSNTSGFVAEKCRRKWLSMEADRKYISGSKGRFDKLVSTP